MNIDVTQDDIDAARLTGATGAQLIERSIHSALDRAGVPCAGRAVTVTMDTITIDLPPGSPIRHSRGGVGARRSQVTIRGERVYPGSSGCHPLMPMSVHAFRCLSTWLRLDEPSVRSPASMRRR